MLIEAICLFAPAVLCVCIYEKLNKSALSLRRWGYHFVLDTLFINLFCFAVKSYILDTGGRPLRADGVTMTPHAALNYLILAVPAAVALAVVVSFLSKHVKVELEENTDEKN